MSQKSSFAQNTLSVQLALIPHNQNYLIGIEGGAGRAGIGPVAAQGQTLFLVRVAVDQALAGRRLGSQVGGYLFGPRGRASDRRETKGARFLFTCDLAPSRERLGYLLGLVLMGV
jgi:hypothetical protein